VLFRDDVSYRDCIALVVGERGSVEIRWNEGCSEENLSQRNFVHHSFNVNQYAKNIQFKKKSFYVISNVMFVPFY
jgi:hypothetical protein